MILQLGKKSYLDSLNIWQKNYKSIYNIKIKLHPIIESAVKTAEKYLPESKGKKFRELSMKLNFLIYKNFQIFYESIKEYLQADGNEPITLELIDEAVSEPKYFDKKNNLIDEEKELTIKLRELLNEKKISQRLSFYTFAFDYFTKIRAGIIKKDKEKMLKKIKARETRYLD